MRTNLSKQAHKAEQKRPSSGGALSASLKVGIHPTASAMAVAQPDSIPAGLISVAALYVERGGAYYGLPDVDPWDQERDARRYPGPHPVVAHPPCERWGSFWPGSPLQVSRGIRFEKGDDGGCFAAAIRAVRQHGGVIEHPRGTHAWPAFGIPKPDPDGGWLSTFFGWTCSVYQGHYGHKALKPTWLFYVGDVRPPELRWGRPEGDFMSVAGTSFASVGARREAEAAGWRYTARLPTALRNATPAPFRDLLISIAKSARNP